MNLPIFFTKKILQQEVVSTPEMSLAVNPQIKIFQNSNCYFLNIGLQLHEKFHKKLMNGLWNIQRQREGHTDGLKDTNDYYGTLCV